VAVDQIDQMLSRQADKTTTPTAAVGPFGVLRRVAEAYPDYSDVQSALVRRYQRCGMNVLANRLLEKWLERRPDDRVANELAKEAAA